MLAGTRLESQGQGWTIAVHYWQSIDHSVSKNPVCAAARIHRKKKKLWAGARAFWDLPGDVKTNNREENLSCRFGSMKSAESCTGPLAAFTAESPVLSWAMATLIRTVIVVIHEVALQRHR